MCASLLVPELPQPASSECRSTFGQMHFGAESTQGWGHLALLHNVLLSPSLHFLLVLFSGRCAVQHIHSPGTVPRTELLRQGCSCKPGLVPSHVWWYLLTAWTILSTMLLSFLHGIDCASLLTWYSPLGEWQNTLLTPYIVSIFVQFSTNATLITSYSNPIVRQNSPSPYHSSAYEHFPKNNDFVLTNVLWDEETSLHPFYK